MNWYSDSPWLPHQVLQRKRNNMQGEDETKIHIKNFTHVKILRCPNLIWNMWTLSKYYFYTLGKMKKKKNLCNPQSTHPYLTMLMHQCFFENLLLQYFKLNDIAFVNSSRLSSNYSCITDTVQMHIMSYLTLVNGLQHH